MNMNTSLLDSSYASYKVHMRQNLLFLHVRKSMCLDKGKVIYLHSSYNKIRIRSTLEVYPYLVQIFQQWCFVDSHLKHTKIVLLPNLWKILLKSERICRQSVYQTFSVPLIESTS